MKFPTHTTLFSVVYRSELETTNFFDNYHGVLEKAWLKTDSIFVLGDLNCCMLEAQNNPGSTLITSKTKNLLRLFEDFNLQNVIAEATRITSTTKSLIDLIVTTKVDVVRCTGVMPLGISDHCLAGMQRLNWAAKDHRRRLFAPETLKILMQRILRLILKRFLFISWKIFITKTMRSGDGNNCLKIYAMLTLRSRM